MEKCLNITQSFLRDEEKLVAVVVVLSSVCQDVEELVKLLLTKLEISQSLRGKCFAKFYELLTRGVLLEAGLLHVLLLVFPTYPSHSYDVFHNAEDVVMLLYRQMRCHEDLIDLQSCFLTFLMKWIQYFPETTDVVLKIFKRYATHQDLEVQNRACEYMRFISKVG